MIITVRTGNSLHDSRCQVLLWTLPDDLCNAHRNPLGWYRWGSRKKRDTMRIKGEEEWGQVLNPILLQSQHTGKAMPTQLETSCRTIPLHLANTETRSFASNLDGFAFHHGFALFSPKSWVSWGKQVFLFGFGFLTNFILILKINKLVSYITACASHWTPSCLPR